ncbi:hypothetical protein RU639_005971 [Aspergillus parasiticus]
MDKFTPTFDCDRFTVYRTWKCQGSVIYQMTTWTDAAAYGLSWISPTKLNVVFLKVQLPTFHESYDKLAASGVELNPDTRNGLSHDLGTMLSQRIAPWETISGRAIKDLCREHPNDIIIAAPEVVGHLRIFSIVWAPQENDRPRLQGMRDFVQENFAWQLRESKIESVIRAPVQWVGSTAARLFLWGSLGPSQA